VTATWNRLRGFVAGDESLAVRHGRTVADLERGLHLYVEPNVAHAAAVPGLLAVASFAYVTLHFGVTAVVLAWLHRTQPAL
jgi:PAP2 superfamily